VIRRRLLAAIVATVAGVMAVTGVVVVSVLEDRLIAGLDGQLSHFTDVRPSGPDHPERIDHRSTRSEFDVHGIAIIEVGPEGKTRFELPSGRASKPDPLPDITGVTTPSTPVTLPSTGDVGPKYRAVATALPDEGMLIAALPLTDVESTVAVTKRILLAAGAGALAIVAAIVWLSIRRGLRPIGDMINAAERIAAGDLTARTGASQPASEVGHLSSALNTMLDRIEQAMVTKVESEARMRRFVADASHELRTPLTSIRGYAELHRQGATSPEEVARGMARIERAAQHMAGLVEDLLLLARLDQGRPLSDEPVDLTRTVQEAVSDTRAADPQRCIVLDLPGHATVVKGDPLRLRQVLDNLLANIHDHTDPGTIATITLADSDESAKLTVADDGPGMSRDEAARAFERFWQAEPTAARSRGAGLGLAIVAELIAAHRGTITLDTNPGLGTAFTITLPLAGSRT
jgi:two-component system OmpR family sensor kinase